MRSFRRTEQIEQSLQRNAQNLQRDWSVFAKSQVIKAVCFWKLLSHNWDSANTNLNRMLSPIYVQWSVPLQSHLILDFKPSEHTGLAACGCVLVAESSAFVLRGCVGLHMVEGFGLSEDLTPFPCVGPEFLSLACTRSAYTWVYPHRYVEMCAGIAKTTILFEDSSVSEILQHLISAAHLSIPSNFSPQAPGLQQPDRSKQRLALWPFISPPASPQ